MTYKEILSNLHKIQEVLSDDRDIDTHVETYHGNNCKALQLDVFHREADREMESFRFFFWPEGYFYDDYDDIYEIAKNERQIEMLLNRFVRKALIVA